MRMTLWLLVIAGCFPLPDSQGPATKDVTLAAYADLHIDASDRSLKVFLGKSYWSPTADPCPLLGAELNAHLDGVVVPVVSRGGKIGDEPGDDVSDNVCGTPQLELDAPAPDGPSLLEISDRATTIVCHLPDLRATRQVMLVPPTSGSWQWRSGEVVTVQWSPGSDLTLWDPFPIELDHVNDAKAVDEINHVHNVTSTGDLVHFTVPSASPRSYQLNLGPPPALTCGAVVATISSSLTTFAASHPVDIVP